MSDRITSMLSGWFESGEENSTNENDLFSPEASETVADSLLIHGFLSDIGERSEDKDAERVSAVMQRIDAEQATTSVSLSLSNGTSDEPRKRRRFATLTSALLVAAAVMLMIFAFGPEQSVSAAMASLEKVVEAASRPMDRTYSVTVAEEYSRDKRPRNLSQEAWERQARKRLNGATLYVRSANEFVMTVLFDAGETRTLGCDGTQSWAFRESGPVHVSNDLDRFRGGLPGWQQDLPFINIHDNLSRLKVGYDVELVSDGEQSTRGTVLSKLEFVRKSRDVRGPKVIEISFDEKDGTIYGMQLDGLPRGGGGPKSVTLQLVDANPLPERFFSHQSHHEAGRRVRKEDSL